jgi:hypothetical protein
MRNTPEEHRSHHHCGRSLKSQKVNGLFYGELYLHCPQHWRKTYVTSHSHGSSKSSGMWHCRIWYIGTNALTMKKEAGDPSNGAYLLNYMVSHLRRRWSKTVSFVEVTDVGQKTKMWLNTVCDWSKDTHTYKQLLCDAGGALECTWLLGGPLQEISVLHLVKHTEKINMS